jgi:dihydroorotase
MTHLILPGLIDCHVHCREPGLTHKGDFQSETRAALAGGVTMICDMPNTVPPTVTVAALKDKIVRTSEIKDCAVRFFFGVAKMSHVEELKKAWNDPTLRPFLCGVKVYLDHSTGDQKASFDVVEAAFKICGELHIPVSCHCEDPGINAAATMENKRKDIAAHSIVRPPESEQVAVGTAIELVRKYGTQLHIAHLSTEGGAGCVRRAKKEGLPVTCEVAPHHLFLTTDDYETLGTLGKMNPPLRSMEHRDALWEAIADRTIDCIATDHAPHLLEEKTRNVEPLQAPSGVPGVETMLPLLLTVAAGKWPHPTSKAPDTALDMGDIRRLCYENPNRIFSLGREDGDAEIEIDPAQDWVICGKDLHSKCGWTPYEGWNVRGKAVNVVR